MIAGWDMTAVLEPIAANHLSRKRACSSGLVPGWIRAPDLLELIAQSETGPALAITRSMERVGFSMLSSQRKILLSFFAFTSVLILPVRQKQSRK